MIVARHRRAETVPEPYGDGFPMRAGTVPEGRRTVGDDYLWLWADRSGRGTVLRVRGELDVVTAERFIADAVIALRYAIGPIAVDLSFLDFVDCAGAHALEAVLRAIPPWRLTDVRGVRPPVARLLELLDMDLSVAPCRRELPLSLRGQELLT